MKQYGLPGATAGLLGFDAGQGLRATAIPAGAFPTGAGLTVLRFVRQLVKDGAEQSAADRVRALKIVTDDEPPRATELRETSRWHPAGADPHWPMPWSVALAGTDGNPDAILTSGYLEDAHEFAYDSLYCEWGYVINFADRVLEIYRGVTGVPPAAGRWVGEALDERLVRHRRAEQTGRQYYAIAQVAGYAFDDLPSDEAFLTHLDHLL